MRSWLLAAVLVVMVTTTSSSDCRASVYEISCKHYTGHNLTASMLSFKTSVVVRGNFTTLTVPTPMTNVRRLRLVSKHPRFPDCATVRNLPVAFPSLVKLDLSGGALRSFDFGCLPTGGDRFDVIDLDANDIDTLEGCEALRSSELSELHMNGNRLRSFDFACLPPTLRILKLKRNRIASLRSWDTLSASPSLQRLYLQLNRIVEFRFAALPIAIDKVL